MVYPIIKPSYNLIPFCELISRMTIRNGCGENMLLNKWGGTPKKLKVIIISAIIFK